MDSPDGQVEVSYPLTLTAPEISLMRTALEMLKDTLGREESDELAEVQALLARLPRTPRP